MAKLRNLIVKLNDLTQIDNNMKEQIEDKLWLQSFLNDDVIYVKNETQNNNQNIDIQCLIIIINDNQKDLQELAINISTACGFTAENSSVITDILPLKEYFKRYPNLTTILLFGIDSQLLNKYLNIPTFAQQTINNKRIINCDSLQKLNDNKQLKNHLWNQVLKPIFKD